MSRRVILILAAATTFASTISLAQRAPKSYIPAIVVNLPFTGQEWTTTTQILADGSTATSAHRVDVWRNSAGSTRRERRILAPASLTSQPTGTLYIDIHDVPKHQLAHLNPATNTGQIQTLGVPAKPTTLPIAIPLGAVVAGPIQYLGTNTIGVYNARGFRLSLSFPIGTKSQTRVVTQTTDTWWSPDIGAVVLEVTKDSLNNSTTKALTQIIKGEPDPSLFIVPSTYTTIALSTAPAASAKSN
jgi:hypothetical protein